MTTTTETTRQVTLSDRRPVRIVKADWEPIARANWFSGQHESQANETAYIRVRQHADGRTLVYCERGRGPGGVHAGYRGKAGGFLLEPSYVLGDGPDAGKRRPTDSDEIIRAIRRCAGIIDLPELGDECIADLPAEEL